MKLSVKKGDYGYYLYFHIRDAKGSPIDLVGYTLNLKAWVLGAPGDIKWTITGSIINALKGVSRFEVANTHFTTAGKYVGEIELTKAGVVESTETFDLEVMESA